jgi:hypothetical protein
MFGFLGATVFNSLYMITGFLIFGGACKGLILNNFVNSDALVTASRIGEYISRIKSKRKKFPSHVRNRLLHPHIDDEARHFHVFLDVCCERREWLTLCYTRCAPRHHFWLSLLLCWLPRLLPSVHARRLQVPAPPNQNIRPLPSF